ncbi:uncharacterized protein [Ptychodera flava]|uniref:uncharacterized protein n=1 Tax=Ptychodera flava TaxID=63121 RepID=UPI00396A5544
MWKYFTYRQTRQWLTILPELLENYNNTVHGSIKMKPVDVTEENDWQAFYTLYGPEMAAAGVTPEFKPGERVRITKYKSKSTFRKGYYQIGQRRSVQLQSGYAAGLGMLPVNKIKNLNGEEILGTFYSNDLQSAAGADEL